MARIIQAENERRQTQIFIDAAMQLPIDNYLSNPMKTFLNHIPTPMLLIVALFLGLAPFVPEPHLWQKIKMLFDANLTKPIDIFDLFMHATPLVLLILKLLIFTQKEDVNK